MMTNLMILLMVFSWVNGIAMYSVGKEGDDVTMSFNVEKDESVLYIKRGNNNVVEISGKVARPLNTAYEKRIRYDKTQNITGYFNFTLLNVSSADAGVFTCSYTLGKTPTCSQQMVIAKEPTEPKVECDPELPFEGKQVTLTCNSASRSLPDGHPLDMKYRWEKNGKTDQADTGFITLNVSRDDRGDNYSCQAFEETPPSNSPNYISYVGVLNSPWSSAFILQPQYGPDSIQIYPEQVLEGRNVTCSADCNPRCNITWRGQAGQLTSGLGNVTFKIDNDQSESSCTAWNIHGNITKIVTLLFPPQISLQTLGDATKTVHEEEPLNFTGVVSSNPAPNVTIRLPNGTSVRMMSEGTDDSNYMISYTIDKATCDDHGIFNGTAKNQFGSDSSSVAVTVYCSPRLDSKPERVAGAKQNSRRFMIQSYPEPTLEAIFSVSPGGNSKAISLPHILIQNDQDTQDGLTIQSNLHEFIVDFPCEASDGKYLLTFNNSEEKENISFSLEESSCHVGAGALVYISVAIVTTTVVLVVLISGVLLYRRRKRAGRRRYSPRGTGNIAQNSHFRQEFATVPKKSERPRKDVNTKVDKTKRKPFVCRKHEYENWPFVGPRSPDYLNPQ